MAAGKILPSLSELGDDLLRVTRWEQFLSFARPLFCFTTAFFFASTSWWPLALLPWAAWMFLTYASTNHDFVHRTLRLPVWLNEAGLCVLEALALRSGHAFRVTHLHHHRRYPHADDVESAGATGSLPRAILSGVGLQSRLFLWAWRHASAPDRRWMTFELFLVAGIWIAAILNRTSYPPLLGYAVLTTIGGWLYPLATVWWPHRNEGRHSHEGTLAVRGRWIPAIFLQHTYHLEHHLYPQVSSHRWQTLAQRLDPAFLSAGIEPLVIP